MAKVVEVEYRRNSIIRPEDDLYGFRGPIQLTFEILTKNITKILTTTVQNRFNWTKIILKILTKLKFGFTICMKF